MVNQVPPGWFPDPADHACLRYWDGHAWTQQVRSRQAPPGSVRTGLFGRRVAAFAIDAVIVFGAASAVRLALRSAVGVHLMAIANPLLLGLLWFVFEVGSVRLWQATPGMRITKLCLRPQRQGRAGALERAAMFAAVFFVAGLNLREILGANSPALAVIGEIPSSLAGLALLLSCLAMLWSDTGRTWHDRLSGTDVLMAGGGCADHPDGEAVEPPSRAETVVICVCAGAGLVLIYANTAASVLSQL